MDIGNWIKQNKLAAGGIAAGAGLLFLSRKGQNTEQTGVLTPVAAAWPSEEMQAVGDSPEALPSEDIPPVEDAPPPDDVPPADSIEPEAVSTPSPLAPNPPSPSTLTIVSGSFPQPPPQVVPATVGLPGDYSAGCPFGNCPPNLGMLIGTHLGFKYLSGGKNSNGEYSTFRFFSDLGNTGDWNYYTSGAKKGEWVGPFNFPRHSPGG